MRQYINISKMGSIYKFGHKQRDWSISGHAAVSFTVVTARSIYFDLRPIGRTCEPKTTQRGTKRKARESRVRLHATSFFRRVRRHLKLVRPSPFYFSRCARTTPSCGTANCHDVTFLGPPLTGVSYACVRACVREQMF